MINFLFIPSLLRSLTSISFLSLVSSFMKINHGPNSCPNCEALILNCASFFFVYINLLLRKLALGMEISEITNKQKDKTRVSGKKIF